MYKYKIVFARKTIISCKQLNGTIDMSGKYFCEHRNGEPIYAIVRADNEIEAYKVAQVLVADMTEKIFGRDYII